MSTVIHVVFGYLFLLLTVRVLSRRPGAQMTMFEFVIVFLIGGVIILSTVMNDRSLTNCTLAVMTVAMMHSLVSWAKLRWPRLGAMVDGTPLVLLANGEWKEDVMRGMHLHPNDVMAAARGKGLRSLDEIQYAILERNGGISIIKRDPDTTRAR
jgi:uncharacterized membrane protein YcaP (DUF421 family)